MSWAIMGHHGLFLTTDYNIWFLGSLILQGDGAPLRITRSNFEIRGAGSGHRKHQRHRDECFFHRHRRHKILFAQASVSSFLT